MNNLQNPLENAAENKYNKTKLFLPVYTGIQIFFGRGSSIMKKFWMAAAAVVLCAAMLLTGCGGGNAIKIGTGGNTGTYFAYSTAVAQILQNKTGLTVSALSTGGSVANINGINDKDYNMGIVQNDTMINAYNGLDAKNFKNGAVTSFSVMGEVYSEVVQIVVDAKLKDKVKTLADLKGLRVSVGDAGSGVYSNAKDLLAAYGLDIDKDIQQNNLSVGSSADAMKDGKLDAFFFTAGAPTTAITELQTSMDVFLLSLEEDVMQKFIDEHKIDGKYEVYSVQPITHAQYACIPEDAPVKTIGVTATFIVANSLSEDDVYNMTKALWESTDEIAKAHAVGSSIDINNAFATIGNVPLHPGAEKYYKEQGLLK